MSVCWGQQTSNLRFHQCLEDSRLVQLIRIGYSQNKTALRLDMLEQFFARVASSFLCSLWRLTGNKTRQKSFCDFAIDFRLRNFQLVPRSFSAALSDLYIVFAMRAKWLCLLFSHKTWRFHKGMSPGLSPKGISFSSFRLIWSHWCQEPCTVFIRSNRSGYFLNFHHF